MKKKLLHVIESAGGGALQYVIDICSILPAEEWSIEVIYSRRYVTPNNLRQYFGDHIKLTEIQMERSISPTVDFRSVKYLYTRFRAEPWHIIHLHSSKAGALGRLAARGLDLPVVYTPHGYAFYQQDINRLSRCVYYGIEWVLNRLHSANVLVSSINEYEDAFRISKDSTKIHRISNSVHIPSIITSLDTSKSEVLIITVGRFTAAKNPMLMLDIIEKLTFEFEQFRFVWVGDGELKEMVTKEAQRRSLPFEVTGWVERDEVEKWLRKCDVFIQSSLWEGLPIALLEAMSYGCPVVVSNIPAHRELVSHNISGVVADNADEFILGIKRFIQERDFRISMGSSARKFIEKNYSITQFKSAIIEFYKGNMKEGVDVGRSTTAVSIRHNTML